MNETAAAAPGQEYYTVPEVARKLHVSVRTVYELLASGEIPKSRFRTALRVRADDLAAYEAKARTSA